MRNQWYDDSLSEDSGDAFDDLDLVVDVVTSSIWFVKVSAISDFAPTGGNSDLATYDNFFSSGNVSLNFGIIGKTKDFFDSGLFCI